MPDEPIIAPANADVPVVVVPAPEPEPENEEVDLVAEMVARGSIEREEQHDETMEAIEQCLSQIANLTASIQTLSQSQSAENPMLAEMQRQLAEVRALQESLLVSQKSSMESKPSIPKEPSSSTNPESPTEEPVTPETFEKEAPPKRRRFRKL